MPYDNDRIKELVAAQTTDLVRPEPFSNADAITPESGFTVADPTSGYVLGPVSILSFVFTHAGAMALVDNVPVELGALAPALQPPGNDEDADELYGYLDPVANGYAGVFPNRDTPGEFGIDSTGLITFTPWAALASVANISFKCPQIIVPHAFGFSADVAD